MSQLCAFVYVNFTNISTVPSLSAVTHEAIRFIDAHAAMKTRIERTEVLIDLAVEPSETSGARTLVVVTEGRKRTRSIVLTRIPNTNRFYRVSAFWASEARIAGAKSPIPQMVLLTQAVFTLIFC